MDLRSQAWVPDHMVFVVGYVMGRTLVRFLDLRGEVESGKVVVVYLLIAKMGAVLLRGVCVGSCCFLFGVSWFT